MNMNNNIRSNVDSNTNQHDLPQGLSRILEILSTAVEPVNFDVMSMDKDEKEK